VKRRVSIVRNFSVLLAAKLLIKHEKLEQFKNITDLLYHHGEHGGDRTLNPAEGKKISTFLFFCVLAFEEFTRLMVVVHTRGAFLLCLKLHVRTEGEINVLKEH